MLPELAIHIRDETNWLAQSREHLRRGGSVLLLEYESQAHADQLRELCQQIPPLEKIDRYHRARRLIPKDPGGSLNLN